jgi:4-alpha-glucanotransferase
MGIWVGDFLKGVVEWFFRESGTLWLSQTPESDHPIRQVDDRHQGFARYKTQHSTRQTHHAKFSAVHMSKRHSWQGWQVHIN